ncbi:MAG TPA: winged helix-turn-helix domain-containing protein [Acidimicrobiia bacterium]|nr:winged helix-turn-helix domain-containing protein [Acidimicrobiia bacterium]
MYRFGECLLDLGRRELHRDGALVHLEPQAFDLLVYLVEHRDRVVPKAELLDGVWGHGFLSESNLTTRVKEARRAVGDDGTRQHAIRNVRGRGYRFVMAVEALGARRSTGSREILLGREAELATTIELLERAAVVTLTGPGGVGKSTLARSIASQTGPSCPDGSWIVELGSLGAGSPVLPTVARRLDLVVDEYRADDAIRTIARLDALIVLDDCEHVADEVSELVDRLLAVPNGALRILATSRVRLGSSAETVVALAPLEIAAARELFSTRARAVLPNWDLAAVGNDRVERLVDELDRLPLTIEMAAARLGSMTLDELEAAIRSGASLLQMHHRATARRHRSLESVVDWSVALLEPAERRVLDGFSVFSGPVTAADGAAVLAPDDPGSIQPSLAALAEQSLLVAELDGPVARYSMLATVRAVADRRLTASGTGGAVRARHAAHILAAVHDIDDQLRTPREPDARDRLAGLVDEVRAAHQWAQHHDPTLAAAISTGLFQFAHSSLWFEPADWAAALLAQHGGDSRLDGARLAAAGAASHRGHLALAHRHASTVAATATGRPRAIAVEMLADLALYAGDLRAVRRAAEELRRLGDELDDPHASAFAAVDVSLAHCYGGDPAAALADLDGVDPGTVSPTDRAWLAYARGEALSAAGEPDAATGYRDAIELGTPVGSRFVISVALTSLATELTRTGDLRAALVAYADALALLLRHGNHTHAVTATRSLVGLLDLLGDERGAVVLGGATTHERVPASYGAAATALTEVLETTRRRVGEDQYATWFAEGRTLDLDQCLRTATRMVAEHLH